MITDQNIPAAVSCAPSLTWRDATVLSTLLTWMAPSPQPVGILALQECSEDLLKVLDNKMRYGPYRRADSSTHGDAVLIYHSTLLRLTDFTMHEGAKSAFTGRHGGSGKPLAVAIFERAVGPQAASLGLLRILAGKIPGNPTGVHLEEYCAFLLQLFSRVNMRTLIVGDFNFLEAEVLEALQRGKVCPWTGAVLSHYPTNIQPEGLPDIPDGFGGGPLAPKRIDHILQLGGSVERGHFCGILAPDEVLPGLQRVVDAILKHELPALPKGQEPPIWEKAISPEACVAFLSDVGPPDRPPPSESAKPSYAKALLKGTSPTALQRTPSERVAGEAKVPRELARAALNRPEVAFAPSPEAAAVEWLLQKDVEKVAELLRNESSALTSPGPFRKSPHGSPWGSPQQSPSESPSVSPAIRPSALDLKKEKLREFKLDILTPSPSFLGLKGV